MPKTNKKTKSGRKARMQQKRQQDKQRRITLYTVLLLLVTAAAAWGFVAMQNPSPSQAGFQLDAQPALGNPDALVKVVEFGDFKCPACKAFHEQVFPELKRQYVDTGKVTFYFMNYQFLAADSITAGIGGECVYHQNEAAFWNYYNTLYANQGPESQQWATLDRLVELARLDVPGIDLPELRRCIDEKRYLSDVQADRTAGTNAGVRGTPTLFVNGQKVSNFSFPTLKTAIDKALEEAQNQ